MKIKTKIQNIKGKVVVGFNYRQEKELKDYVCCWCGFKFQQWVRKFEGHNYNTHTKSRSSASSQVHCPKCKEGLKTWD